MAGNDSKNKKQSKVEDILIKGSIGLILATGLVSPGGPCSHWLSKEVNYSSRQVQETLNYQNSSDTTNFYQSDSLQNYSE